MAQRAAMISILVAIQSFAGILAPVVTGSVIEAAATLLEGYYTGYTITALVQLFGGLAGLLCSGPSHEARRSANASRDHKTKALHISIFWWLADEVIE